MINMKNVSYEVILVMDDGKNLDLTNAVQDMGWEENKGELAMRINIAMANITYSGKKLSSLAKPGSLIGIIAKWGSGSGEAARGTIVEWETATANAGDTLSLVCYDDLFNLQASQDNIYYKKGTGTKAAIKGILDDWGIDIEKYNGPNESHAKMVYKGQTLSDVLLDILDDAKKKGAEKCFFRSSKGRISVLPRGSNSTVYHFGTDNTIVSRNRQSTANLVTRVKVLGKEDNDGKTKVESVLNGKTKYGIRQRIVYSAQADSLSEAKKNAQEILDDSGDIEKIISVESPDVPVIRKGDLVHMEAGTLKGYYYVEGIRHNAASCTMVMDLELAEEEKKDTSSSTTFNKGDKVILNGAVYVDSYGKGKGRTFTNYKGTITIKVDTSRKCPYHIDHIGWVYPNTIKKA